MDLIRTNKPLTQLLCPNNSRLQPIHPGYFLGSGKTLFIIKRKEPYKSLKNTPNGWVLINPI